MDIIKLVLSKANPDDFIIFILTILIVFISWLIKGLFEKPLSEAKKTFFRFLEKRLEILIEIRVRLVFIAYFPKGKDSSEYKEQLKNIILRDEKVVYLDKNILDSVLKIVIDTNTEETLLLETISKIDDTLYSQIIKIRDENNFYIKYYNCGPFKRFWSLALLSLKYIGSIIIIILILFLILFVISYFLKLIL